VWGEVWFSDLDLSQTDRLLFRAATDCPGFGTYDSLFAAVLADGGLEQLTVFPERAVYLADQGILQLQNRYGLFRTDAELKNPAPLAVVPSFVADGQVESGKLNLLQHSPDGRFLLALRPTSPAFGELILYDLEQGGPPALVSAGVELSLKAIPALWSPASDFFLYTRQGSLYYFSIAQQLEKRVLAEGYRLIGRGTVRNVRWGGASTLYYVDGSLVYGLDTRELFTRSMYAGYLPIGRLAGKIPFEFDPNFDDFWVAPDAAHVLVGKGGRNLFLYPLTQEDYSSAGETRSLPYLYLPGSVEIKRVLWTKGGAVTVLTQGLDRGGSRTAVYRLAVPAAATVPAFQKAAEQGVQDLVLSPAGTTVAVLRESGVDLYDAESWQKLNTRSHPRPLHALWTADQELIIAGAWFTELWNPGSGGSRLVCLSQPGGFSFAQDEQSILTEVQGAFYRRPLSLAAAAWSATGSAALRERRLATESFRVYLEDSPNRLLRNRIMVRDLRKYGTRELLAKAVTQYEPYPARDEPVDPSLFAHGSRIRRREVALTFNAVDSVAGLASILTTLADYQIRATFFVNGEAIRRHPDAVRAIAEAGHEVGSLFYTHFNMTDARFRLDPEFIKRGLARTEDEYFAAAGRELALLWHAPYYLANSEIIAAARELNYVYVSRDLDSLDWVTTDAGKAAPDIYFPAAELVERIVTRKRPGSIVPILTGRPAGWRQDYLFQKLDLLIDALLALGYSVVPVSALMEHSR
jgi:peptidoglycan/xylan/chitin deacetylase (PgdA/CDA1 family)